MGPSSEPSNSCTFDLTSQRSGRAKWDLPTRVVAVGTGALVTTTGLYLSFVPRTSVPNQLGVHAIFDFIAAAGILAIAVGLLLTPGPYQIRATIAGVDAVDPRGRRRRLVSWSDPKLRVELWDFRGSVRDVRGYLAQRTGIMWTRPGFRGFDITFDAMEGIMASAQGAGCRIETSAPVGRAGAPGGTEVTITSSR